MLVSKQIIKLFLLKFFHEQHIVYITENPQRWRQTFLKSSL